MTDSGARENILILGLRRSGKSSIVEVVYKSLRPDDSLFLDSTLKCQPLDVNTFQSVRIWDGTSGNVEAAQQQQRQGKGDATSQAQINARGKFAWGTGGQLYWTECAAVIFVIDSQDDLYDAIDRLNDVIIDAYACNPLIHFHVFVHKVDGHSVDYRYDTLQNIQSRVADNLADASASFIFAPIAHEILAEAAHEAQALASEQQQQQDCATDANRYSMSATLPSDHAAYRGASGSVGGAGATGPVGTYSTSMSNFAASSASGLHGSGFAPDLERDVRLSFHTTSIYNPSVFVAFSRVQIDLMNVDLSRTLETLCNGLSNSCKFEKVYLFDVPTRTYVSADSSPFDENNFEAISEYLDFLVQFSGLYKSLSASTNGNGSATAIASHGNNDDDNDETRYSTSIARLSPDSTLGVSQINHHLALAFCVRTDIHAKHAGMIDFNIAVARKAITDVYVACHAA